MKKEQIVKILVKRAFKEAAENSSATSVKTIADHIGVRLKLGIDRPKIFERAYQYCVEGRRDGKDMKFPTERTINLLCEFLGLGDYNNFRQAYFTEVEVEEMSYNSLSLLDNKDIEVRIFDLSSTINNDSKNDQNFFWLGMLLFHKKQYDHAIERLTKAIQINPTKEEYYYILALAKFKGNTAFGLNMQRIKEVLAIVDRAIDINPEQIKFYGLKWIINQDYFKRRGLSIPKQIPQSKVSKFKELLNASPSAIEIKPLRHLIDQSLILAKTL